MAVPFLMPSQTRSQATATQTEKFFIFPVIIHFLQWLFRYFISRMNVISIIYIKAKISPEPNHVAKEYIFALLSGNSWTIKRNFYASYNLINQINTIFFTE